MKAIVKKSRFFYLHPKTNPKKVRALEDLQSEYTSYLKVCVASMIEARTFKMLLSRKKYFFPGTTKLSCHIVSKVRDHAITIVSSWAAATYATTLKSLIIRKFREGSISDDTRAALCILGKRLIDKPSGRVTQAALDMYWGWLTDASVVGSLPTISSQCGMRLGELTGVLTVAKESQLTEWWLSLSHLHKGKRVQLPLSRNPYVKCTDDVSKGILARKTKTGTWRFEVVEKKEWDVPTLLVGAPRLGVDVGLNVLAASSDGRLFGLDVKPKFDSLYDKIKSRRANRQRQGLKDNSPALARAEARLSGFIKSSTGSVANSLVRAYPDRIFVIEDLDLRGCKGQKRFAYHALHAALSRKAPVLVVHPAYSSQMCPSCGYISRLNRQGTKFTCRSCGRISHADVVGGINLLGRSEDKQLSTVDHTSVVRALLRERFRARCRTSSSGECSNALEPSSRRLTVKESVEGFRTASNPVPVHSKGWTSS